jgi:hypothetical protein
MDLKRTVQQQQQRISKLLSDIESSESSKAKFEPKNTQLKPCAFDDLPYFPDFEKFVKMTRRELKENKDISVTTIALQSLSENPQSLRVCIFDNFDEADAWIRLVELQRDEKYGDITYGYKYDEAFLAIVCPSNWNDDNIIDLTIAVVFGTNKERTEYYRKHYDMAKASCVYLWHSGENIRRDEWKIMKPSYYATWQEALYKYQNPESLRDDQNVTNKPR